MRGRQRKRCGLDAAGLPQGNHAVPAFVGDSRLALFVVIAALGHHQDLTPIIRATRVLQVQRTQGGPHALLFALLGKPRRLAIPLAREGHRRQWPQDVTQEQDDIGPRMPDDRACAVIARVGLCRVPTGAGLPWTVHDDPALPGPPVASCERLGTLPGWCCGETLQRGRRHRSIRLQQLRKEGCRQSGSIRSASENQNHAAA